MRGISCLAEDMLASQEGLFSMEKINKKESSPSKQAAIGQHHTPLTTVTGSKDTRLIFMT